MTKMAGGNQIKTGFGHAGGGARRHGTGARFSMESSERARRASPMGMPAIDVRELSDEMLIFMLQLMAPEKYGSPDPQGGDAQSHRSSVSSDQSLAGKKAGGGRSEMPGEAPARGKTDDGMVKIETESNQSSVISKAPPRTQSGKAPPSTQCASGGKDEAEGRSDDRGQRSVSGGDE